jgi:hypothetical protein
MEIWTGQVCWLKNFFVNLPYSGAQHRFSGLDFCHCSNNGYQKNIFIHYHQKRRLTREHYAIFQDLIEKKRDPENTPIVFIVP